MPNLPLASRSDRTWHPERVLSEMRNRRGGLNWRMRALAILLVLLLAAPLTALVFQFASRALNLSL